ncbi:MAG: hypothetical protein K8R68_11925 [Bacteroidales bacterium]|nr:hypothetical protein [Bacteroidales bacterium]
MEAIVKRYDAKLDNKKRLTIRGTKYDFYYVQEFNDGTLVLKPRILVGPNELSKNTLRMMEKSIDNFKKGNASKPIDIDKYLQIAAEPNEV